MKRGRIFLAFFMLFAGILQAQEFYTRFGVGVSGGTSSALDLLYRYTNNGSSRMVAVVPVAFGKGVTGVAAFGYNPSKYIGLEIGISEFMGFNTTADSVWKFPGGSSAEAKIKGNMLSLVPAIVIRAGLGDLDPYARLGFVLGIRPTARATSTFTNTGVNPAEEWEAVRQYYGGVAAGLNAAAGVTWKLDDVVSVYAEFAFTSISYSPYTSEVVKYEKNGVDELMTLTVKQTKTEFYSNINPDEVIPDTSPDKQLRKSLPYSNAGLAFGVLFHF